MLLVDNEDMDLLLINVMIGWFFIVGDVYEDLIFYGEYDFDEQCGYCILCLMVGVDEEVFFDLVCDLEFLEECIKICLFDYEQVVDFWEVVIDLYFCDSDVLVGKIIVIYELVLVGFQVFVLFLREVEILEQVVDEFDIFYCFLDLIIFCLDMCGEVNVYWDLGVWEVIMCYELLGEFVELFLSELLEENQRLVQVSVQQCYSW